MERKVISINQDWQFCRAQDWDDSIVELANLPHTVRIEPENYSGCRNYQGPCIYRKEIFVPDEYVGKKILLEFEGAMGRSRLTVNETFAKEHFCGYTPLVADVSTLVKYGENNIVEVFLDNSDDPELPPGKPQKHLDFAYEGGLYRNARMTVSEPVYITHPLLANEKAGGGIFVWYTDVSDEVATVHSRVQVKNETECAKTLSLKTSVIDKDGKTVGENCQEKQFAAGDALYFEGEITVNNPKLWCPEEPNLYTLRCEVLEGDVPLYVQDTEIGIRTFEFTVNDGVIFNGKSRSFNGVNYHQNWPYIGNGVPDNLLIRDIMKLKEIGTENIRSHYPFSSSVTSACNRLGITLIVSNPGWQFCAEGLFMERSIQNVRDIVRWQRNNPCILFWEPILNESKMTDEIQLGFHNTVHEEFPYTPCYTASDHGPTDISYQQYDPDMLGKDMAGYGDDDEKISEARPAWVREYGDYPDNFRDQNTVWRCKRSWGDAVMVNSVNRMLGTIEKFDANKVSRYIQVYNSKRICGYGVWPAIAHNRGYHINPCWGGHLDLFRVPKFSYYFMRSQMDREQVGDILFVANWWSEFSPEDVTVYSNAERVALYWNDQFIAEQCPDDVDVKHPPFTFKGVKTRYFKCIRDRSSITAKAYVGDKVVAEQTVMAPGIAKKLKLEADFMGIPLKADGADIVAVRCSFVDREGVVVPITCDEHPIVFEIEGEGEIIGDSSVGANPKCADAGIATVLVRSTSKAGEIKLRAKMLWEQPMGGAIEPDEIIIKSE